MSQKATKYENKMVPIVSINIGGRIMLLIFKVIGLQRPSKSIVHKKMWVSAKN
jgi:hypothetical protein